jgi:hypothetical protein
MVRSSDLRERMIWGWVVQWRRRRRGSGGREGGTYGGE